MRARWIAVAWTALAFMAQDAAWIQLMSPRLYRPALADLLTDTPDLLAGGLFYVVYLAGLLHFVVFAAIRRGQVRASWPPAVLFALAAYGTYDLTNQATLRAWPWHVTLIDLGWSAWASGSAAAVGTWAGLRWGGTARL